MTEQHEDATHGMGKGMILVAWLIGLAMLTWFFAGIEERQINPNQSLSSTNTNDYVEVSLDQNRMGHYVMTGKINGSKVVFLVDTGATTVAIPESVARRLGLEKGRPFSSKTANGISTSYRTLIAQLNIGNIELHNLEASILPNMAGEEILLGMSALRQLELVQRGETLTMRQWHQ